MLPDAGAFDTSKPSIAAVPTSCRGRRCHGARCRSRAIAIPSVGVAADQVAGPGAGSRGQAADRVARSAGVEPDAIKPLGSAAVPAGFVPIRLPCDEIVGRARADYGHAVAVLPEMTLPAPGRAADRVAGERRSRCSMPSALGIAAVPAALVPTRLPADQIAAGDRADDPTPSPVLPEITLPAPGVGSRRSDCPSCSRPATPSQWSWRVAKLPVTSVPT